MIDEKLIEKLIGLGLSIEQYLGLYLIYIGNSNLYNTYRNKFYVQGSILLDNKLMGYINDSNEITPKFEQEFKEFLQTKEDEPFIEIFKELKKHYPVKVEAGKSVRRLHSNPDKCKKLYKKILTGPGGKLDLEKHKHILKCIDFETIERKKGRKEEFWQLMPTYLHQRSWELVEEDLSKINNLPTKENTNYEVI